MRFLVLLLLATPSVRLLADDSLARFEASVPRDAADFTEAHGDRLAQAARAVEVWAAELTWPTGPRSSDQTLDSLELLFVAKQRADAALTNVLALRTVFVQQPETPARRDAIRQYLRATSQLIELSGRLRYLQDDAVGDGARRLDVNLEKFARLLDLLVKHRVPAGADELAYVLLDPPPGRGLEPYPRPIREKLLDLIEATRHHAALPTLVRYLRQPTTPPELAIRTAEIIRECGLPQDPRPGQDPTLPAPAITAKELRDLLGDLQLPFDSPLRPRRLALFAWLNRRMLFGVEDDSYRIGEFTVRAGDWLLMRNPSPYNLFTDLSPGLFTHVGVVATTTDGDDRRRFVIVDLPEQGDRIPATNVEIYLQRTVHYVFLRHESPDVGQRMGETAAILIGNPSQFDLTFRTDRVAALRGQSLRGANINTYCAGFLLLCAQETTQPRTEFFPIPESPAGENCPMNLEKLGLSLGQDFVSPTGAIFSPHLSIAGRREPLYTPSREIEEQIYDHFAHAMIHKVLTPSPNAVQLLREKVAELSKYNPWLARTLAKANNVSERLDLQAASKAAAVVETLDEIAQGNSRAYLQAFDAFIARPDAELRIDGVADDVIQQLARSRAEHTELYQQWTARRLTPRELRERLVAHYVRRGQEQLDKRFFP